MGKRRRIPALKIEKQFLEDHQVKLRVEADPEQLEDAKRRAARSIAKRTKIPGFRPGKAPYHIIERSVGPAAIFEEAVELLVDDMYPKAIDEAEIQPYGPGQLEGIPSNDPLVFEFVIPLKAEVELGDHRSISIPYEIEPLSEDQVDKVLQNMRDQQAVLEPVERESQTGDEVSVRIKGERQDPDTQEWLELIRDMPAPVIIDPKDDENNDEWPFPGFSRRLVGLTAGQELDLTYTYPEDAQYETLRGAEARFHVAIEGVKARSLPELDDDFAISHSEFESLEQLRSEVQARLEERALDEYNQEYNDKVLNELVEKSTIKFPPQMLQDEIDSMLHDLEHRLERQYMDIETYLKSRQMDREALRAELAPMAENRLRRLLVLFEVGKKEDIKVKPEEVQAETINTLSQMYGQMPTDQARKQITPEVINNLTSSITADLMVQNTLKRLRSIASGIPEPEEKVTPLTEETEAGGEFESELAQAEATESEIAESEPPQSGSAEDEPASEIIEEEAAQAETDPEETNIEEEAKPASEE
jgi:trigger factor